MSHDLLLETILAERRREAEAVARERLATRARAAERARSGGSGGRWAAIQLWLGATLAGIAGVADRPARPDSTPDCCDGAVG